ncbi:MAG: response regulator [Beijerinckiaceae bacterium]|nr:response regulator [Beijerinckiaceae bacterium]MCI0737089.1 response regulator [Beijerinckiaceae bacterium]
MSAEASPRRQRILIVEDEPLIAVALESTLRELGFDAIGTVTRISAALEAIGREQIDGAILDVNLGLQRIDPVADALAARACPFFFMTGYGVSEVPAGHADRAVLQKPFRLEQLLTALQAEFGSPPDSPPKFERGTLRARGDRHPAERHSPQVPTPGP